jgi:hypothetical protein
VEGADCSWVLCGTLSSLAYIDTEIGLSAKYAKHLFRLGPGVHVPYTIGKLMEGQVPEWLIGLKLDGHVTQT